jgi:uncharacterized membrane protein
MSMTTRVRRGWAAAAALAILPGGALAASAQTIDSGLTTPYPGVVIDAGKTAAFELVVDGVPGQTLELSTASVPEGWTARFTGGGTVIDAVTVANDPAVPTALTLEVEIPPDAAEGTYEFNARAGAATLPLSVTVQPGVSGDVTLTPDFPGLRGPTDAAFTFSVTVDNSTNADVQLELEGTGPDGWSVTAEPSGQAQASAITLEPGDSSTVTLSAEAPLDAEAGLYEVGMTATGENVDAALTVQVELVGDLSLQITTPDQRLNAAVTADVPIVVFNDGSAPLAGVTLSASAPTDWEVTFSPETVAQMAPGDSTTVTASVTPSESAIAGDYQLTFTATADTATDTMDIRTTVNPSAVWGIVGVGLIALTLAGLALVFRRFGRR